MIEIVYNTKIQCYSIAENGKYIFQGFETYEDAMKFLEAAQKLAEVSSVDWEG